MRNYIADQYRNLLIRLQIPLLYQRIVVWWETKASLRDQLKALRAFVQARRIELRNAVFGTAMIVATKQIQSRAELRDMTPAQIMAAWRGGRLDFLTKHTDDDPRRWVRRYGGDEFREWVHNGGQIRRRP